MTAAEIAALWEPLAEKIGRPRCGDGTLQWDDGEWLILWDGGGINEPAASNWRAKDIAPINDAMTAALWRDHAVRWLAERTAIHMNGIGGSRRIWVQTQGSRDGPEDTEITIDGYRYERVHGETFDHALAAACRAVPAEVKA